MKYEALCRANLSILKFFCSSLNKSERAKKYILSRLSRETIQKYYLGYAPYKGLISFLKSKDIPLSVSEYLGIIGTNDYGGLYSTFTDRIMIPIIQYGKVIGFGGRILTGNRSKYLNSKSSLLYNKSEVLYPIDVAINAINLAGYAILVEGYLDVLSLADNHIYNVVACCGTAFKEEHSRLLKRWTDSVIICLDGDSPGKEAAKKAEKLLRKIGAFGGKLELENEDPDEFIKRVGKQKFLKKIEDIRHE